MCPASLICAALVISAVLTVSLCDQPCRTVFTPIQQGLLCIRSPFVETFPSISSDSGSAELQCSQLCSNRQNCQAFSTADGPCQLFVFDRCSKSVRDCSCSRRGRVFVKQQQGLQAGQLCPPGFGKDLCGVKYRIFSTPSSWSQGRQKCASERGLVIMADVVDSAEMSHVRELFTGNSNRELWLGGFQTPGSPEPSGGWSWIDCSLSVGSFWESGQPNNHDGDQDAISMQDTSGLDDRTKSTAYQVLCECLDPFN